MARLITVHTLTYNEEFLIQFFIDHYRERFPNCHIVIYDNNSIDKTVEIANKNNCEIRSYNSGGVLNDGIHVQIKNTCWKNAKTNWVLVCDSDELLDINQLQLMQEESCGTTLIRAKGYNMINMEDNLDFKSMKFGFDERLYDKYMLFDKRSIKDINYDAGAHGAYPAGKVKIGNQYPMYHYKFINFEMEYNKRQVTLSRMSDDNKKMGWGIECFDSKEKFRQQFDHYRKIARKVKP